MKTSLTNAENLCARQILQEQLNLVVAQILVVGQRLTFSTFFSCACVYQPGKCYSNRNESFEELSRVARNQKAFVPMDLVQISQPIAFFCRSADQALDRFAMKRFYDDKLGGLTEPSQRRSVFS